MILLKIGGSILTDKSKERTILPDRTKMIAKQIADSGIKELVLIHGAGSFGHPQVLTHLQCGFNAEGLWITHKTVSELNSAFIEELHVHGIRALPVHPLNCSISNSGRIDYFDLCPIKMMLENDLVPVIHGDIVLDKYIKFSILSGDQIIAYLAKVLKPRKVGIGTNVDGVLYKGKTLRHLHSTDFNRLKREIRGSNNMDVTGGMLKKVTELVELANYGIRSQIFNAEVMGNITRFLTTFDEFGTVIMKEDDNK
jgi:isopentenyl phosphate kinase